MKKIKQLSKKDIITLVLLLLLLASYCFGIAVFVSKHNPNKAYADTAYLEYKPSVTPQILTYSHDCFVEGYLDVNGQIASDGDYLYVSNKAFIQVPRNYTSVQGYTFINSNSLTNFDQLDYIGFCFYDKDKNFLHRWYTSDLTASFFGSTDIYYVRVWFGLPCSMSLENAISYLDEYYLNDNLLVLQNNWYNSRGASYNAGYAVGLANSDEYQAKFASIFPTALNAMSDFFIDTLSGMSLFGISAWVLVCSMLVIIVFVVGLKKIL